MSFLDRFVKKSCFYKGTCHFVFCHDGYTLYLEAVFIIAHIVPIGLRSRLLPVQGNTDAPLSLRNFMNVFDI